MQLDERAPQRGSFVRDQVAGLRAAGAEVELLEFSPGRSRYRSAIARIREAIRGGGFDLIHAHYGLTGWCAALAGARPLAVTFHGTDVRHPIVGRLSRLLARRADLVGVVSRDLLTDRDGRRGLRRAPGRTAILPCGAALARFQPLARAEARAELGLDAEARLLLFPADPARQEKRFDRAAEVARESRAELLTARGIPPERMALWINAASVVLITSDYEGFGLAAVEALACGRPVLSTPVGIAPALLDGVEGCLVAPFDRDAGAEAARRHLDAGFAAGPAPRAARWLGADLLAERVLAAYEGVIDAGRAAVDRRARRLV
jgi:glycosyltransferase involved in cell wall biosynthesis